VRDATWPHRVPSPRSWTPNGSFRSSPASASSPPKFASSLLPPPSRPPGQSLASSSGASSSGRLRWLKSPGWIGGANQSPLGLPPEPATVRWRRPRPVERVFTPTGRLVLHQMGPSRGRKGWRGGGLLGPSPQRLSHGGSRLCRDGLCPASVCPCTHVPSGRQPGGLAGCTGRSSGHRVLVPLGGAG
jgi:hypothetical protein